MRQRVTVVWDKKTRKIIPFDTAPNGEIIILTTGAFTDESRIIVSSIDAYRLDLENGYVLGECDLGKKGTQFYRTD